jgi:hypothetical protein
MPSFVFSYYINYDIDFYRYYEILNQEEASNKIGNNTQNKNTDTLSVDTLMKEVQDFKKTKNEKTLDKNVLSLLKNDNKEISINNNLFNDIESIDEGILNMNFLFMKNLHEKLTNFFDNDNLENIFLVNLLITIISVPCLNFDPDLVKSTAVILDDSDDNKYSFLTLFRHLAQKSLEKLKDNEKMKEQLQKFIDIIFKNNNKIKGLDKEKEKKENKKKDDDEESEDEDFLIFLLKKDDNDDKMETTNIIIFCEFIKEYICSISHKHQFEGLVENLYGLYSDELKKQENVEDEIR